MSMVWSNAGMVMDLMQLKFSFAVAERKTKACNDHQSLNFEILKICISKF